MNSQGTVFSQNELAYSALKSALHSLGVDSPRAIFEVTAEILPIGNTANLAQIMLQVMANSLDGTKLDRIWDAGTVRNYFKEKTQICEGIRSELNSLKLAAENLREII